MLVRPQFKPTTEQSRRYMQDKMNSECPPEGYAERQMRRKEQADAELRSTEHSGGQNAKTIR